MSRAAFLAGLLIAWLHPAAADELVLPAPALDRDAPVMAIWRPATPQAGSLGLDWTDSAGRLVERHRVSVAASSPELAIAIDLRRAVMPHNHLLARFVPDDGGPEKHSEADFIARPAAGWPGYQVLMWQDQSPAALAALPGLGVTGTAIVRPASLGGQDAIARRLAAGLRVYTENLATDFYASYHRWTPGRAVNWRFDAVRTRHLEAPEDPGVFLRDPGLSDPLWLDTVAARLRDIAGRAAPYRPLFHNLADESGIADLAANWDFDLSPASLDGMRHWLASRYGSLAALNRAWGSAYASWDTVRPALTDAAIADDRAVPSWTDFKAWMDVAFAAAVRVGTDAVHQGDPSALSALEGAQVPGWGGYDYARLADAVDVMEIYDAGNALEIAHALNPDLRILTTVFGDATATQHLWHALLLGARGAVLWDDRHDFVREDGHPGPRGLVLAPLLRRLGGALGAQLLHATPAPGRVAILYSQESFRLQWLLDRRRSGQPWTLRDAGAEFDDENAWRAANRRAAAAMADLGAQARWVTAEQLDGLAASGISVLVLPDSIALSDTAVAAIRRFAGQGGLILADAPPGARDALGRARAEPPLANLASFPAVLRDDGADLTELADLLARAGALPVLQCRDAVDTPTRNIDIRLFRDGAVTFVGIHSLAGTRVVHLHLNRAQWVQSLGYAGGQQLQDLDEQLIPAEPLLLALFDAPPPAIRLTGPAQAGAGDLVEFRLEWLGDMQAAADAVQIDVVDPAGHPVPALEQTILVPPPGAVWRLRLAVNDAAGVWKIHSRELIGGMTSDVAIEVK